jgi:hypothetical protein
MKWFTINAGFVSATVLLATLASGCGSTASPVTSTATPTASASLSTPHSTPSVASQLMTVSPAGGGTGTAIHVVLSGAPPNLQGELKLCGMNPDGSPRSSPDTACDFGGGIAEATDSSGSMDVTYTIATHLTASQTYAICFFAANGDVVAKAPFVYSVG